MKSLLSTAIVLLVSTSAFAETKMYCSDTDQNVQLTLDTALITVDEESVAYKLTHKSQDILTYSSRGNLVTVDLSDKLTSSLYAKETSCVDGSKTVVVNYKWTIDALIQVEDMETQKVLLNCEETEITPVTCQ